VGGVLRPGVGALGLVGQELDGAGRIGAVVLLVDDPERARAAREDVHAPVVRALEDLRDLHRATHRAHALLARPDDAELRAALQALADHRAVALLEDVQRHHLVRERDDAQREEREVAHDAVGHPVSV
jgi:hypothetical protein